MSSNSAAGFIGTVLFGVVVAGVIFWMKVQFFGSEELIASGLNTYRVITVQQSPFAATLFDERSEKLVGMVKIAGRCNKWNDLKIGSRWELPWYMYRNTVSYSRTIQVDASSICTQLNQQAREK